jgi:hypothetical protein
MTERLKNMGRLEEKRLHSEELKLKLRGLIESLREHIDPFETLENLDTDLIASQALELASAKIEYSGLLEEMRAIERALGR